MCMLLLLFFGTQRTGSNRSPFSHSRIPFFPPFEQGGTAPGHFSVVGSFHVIKSQVGFSRSRSTHVPFWNGAPVYVAAALGAQAAGVSFTRRLVRFGFGEARAGRGICRSVRL